SFRRPELLSPAGDWDCLRAAVANGEALGQRSANRSACAQACRPPYQLIVDQVVKGLGDKKHLLSAQDLAGLEQLPDLIRLGVASCKIEGRLKSPEYVAAVTRIYRAAIDDAFDSNLSLPPEVKPDHIYRLEMAFSRRIYSGWLKGMDHQQIVNGRFGKKRGAFLGCIRQIGPDWVELVPEVLVKPGDGVVFDTGEDTKSEQGGRVYEVQGDKLKFQNGQIDFRKLRLGHRVWKTDDPALNRELRASFREAPAHRKQPVDLIVLGKVGSPLQSRMKTAENASVEVSSSQLLASAKTVPLTSASLCEHLGRLAGTRFVLRGFRAELAGEPFLPIGAVNDLGCQAVQKLEAFRLPPDIRSVSKMGVESFPHEQRNSPAAHTELIVLCRTFEQIEAALESGVNTIYADFEDIRRYREVVSRVGTAALTFLAAPRIQKPGEQRFLRLIANCKPNGVLVRNLGSISFFQENGVRMRGDFSLNVNNPITAQLLVERGLEKLTISYDLNLEQILALLQYEPADRFELTIHQHMPMFHMERSVFATFLSDGTDYTNCGRPRDSHSVQLRDRIGLDHFVKADVGCRNTVFNARAQTGSRYTELLIGAGLRIFRIEFLDEDHSRASKVIRLYRKLLERYLRRLCVA
ncbi:MAG: U32 family peptidase, partial [Verrucomicrobia bacterium]|nr:U32 family peptidase [Verrucomicrobiota bacterium]